MRIAEVIGTVTLSQVHPSLRRMRWIIGVPCSAQALRENNGGDQEDLVILDQLGAGMGDLIALTEGAEAAAPFYPDKKPVDAYSACILDSVNVLTEEDF